MVDYDRSALGVESAPSAYEVENGAMRQCVEAIEDDEPLYHDEQAARAAGFNTVLVPPTFL